MGKLSTFTSNTFFKNQRHINISNDSDFSFVFFEAVCHANCGGVRKRRTPFPSIKTNLLISSSLFLVISVTT